MKWWSESLVSILAAWLVAQVIKAVLAQNKSKTHKSLLVSGGMPSKHSAAVTAAAMSSALTEGVDSSLFAVSTTLAVIVMYDAMNVRRAVGQNRAAILKLYDQLKNAEDIKEDDPLRDFESLGHTPTEVIVGAAIGILVAFVINLLT